MGSEDAEALPKAKLYCINAVLFQFWFLVIDFTAQCNLVQSAVLRSHVVRPSVCLSVCDVGGL